MKKVRWGIVGAARINEKLIPAICQSEFAELIAIGSRRPEAAIECVTKYAKSFKEKINCFNDLNSIINSDSIDAIYIPLSNEEHTKIALEAIKNKKHVLIEKPMAIKAKEVETLIHTAKINRIKIMEGFMYAFHPQFDKIQSIINSGIIGDVNYGHSMFSFPIQPARFYRINRDIKHGGGALWDIGPYAIHTIRQCFKNKPIRVYAQSKINEHGADISTTGMIDFGDNKRATFDISFECTRRSEFELFGANGRLKCPTVWQSDSAPAKIIYTTEKSGPKEEVVPTANHFNLEIKHFNEVILKDLNPKLSGDDAIWNCKTLEAIQESIYSKEWVLI